MEISFKLVYDKEKLNNAIKDIEEIISSVRIEKISHHEDHEDMNQEQIK